MKFILVLATTAFAQYEQYQQPIPQPPVIIPPQDVPVVPPPVITPKPDLCASCMEVKTNFDPALIRQANCARLGIDLINYEILSAMRLNTNTDSECRQTIKCSDYATDSIWIGNFEGQFSCHHDNVFQYHTVCTDGLRFVDQDRDHMYALVCLKKVERLTQPPATLPPATLPPATLPPVVIPEVPTVAPDVPAANGYSGY
ncbi:hypothetical protein WR25_03353 [Diploscapter pachys]|uniref:Uncharacterized protein n=1 Tax=Diploscapter pachys TaxID=2018661 RepID=A0A2A2L3E3_9BILA|nr:hypothetical protein WR25_03353 [Diploscapter pachys]